MLAEKAAGVTKGQRVTELSDLLRRGRLQQAVGLPAPDLAEQRTVTPTFLPVAETQSLNAPH